MRDRDNETRRPRHKLTNQRRRPSSHAERIRILTARERIIGAFWRYNGAVWVGNSCPSYDNLAKALARYVHNRDRRLGDPKKGEVIANLAKAIKSLHRDGLLIFDDSGWVGLSHKVDWPQRAAHNQKYPKGYRKSRAA